MGSIELLMTRLPQLVGSPLSVNGIAEQLQISHKTIAKWLTILERLYAIFILLPFGSPKVKAVKKARKHYHFDWSLVPESSFQFENLVASHLLKWVNFRDIEGREVDFVVTENGRPTLLVECKSSDRDISSALRYLKERFPAADAWQVCVSGSNEYVSKEGIRVAPALELLKRLA